MDSHGKKQHSYDSGKAPPSYRPATTPNNNFHHSSGSSLTAKQQQQQLQQQSSNIITLPISMANSININTNNAAAAADLSDNTISTAAHSPSLGGKQNIIRLLPTSKTILTSPTGGSGQHLVNRQRIVTTNLSATSPVPTDQRPSTPQQHQPQRSTSGFQLLSSSGNVVTINSSPSSSTTATSTPTGGSIVKMSAQQFAALQQKQAAAQQQQHIIMKQSTSPTGVKMQTGQTVKTQRVILGNTSVIGQSTQGKNIILQQLPVGSSTSVVVTPTTTTTSVSATTTLSGSNKIQTINTTILTPQQQRILMQNLKQQQQQQQYSQPQQTTIYRKPLPVTTIQPQIQPQIQQIRSQPPTPTATPSPYRFFTATPQLHHLQQQQPQHQQVYRTPEEINISLQQRRPQIFIASTTPRYYEDEYLYERK
uniref:MarB protein n=1 Tax=Musca domestica TaxID=7370 RepID=T1P7G8_MUSDO